VNVDQCIVAQDLAFRTVNESHTAHIGGELIDLVWTAALDGESVGADFRFAQIK
jgi:hypothetical protein